MEDVGLVTYPVAGSDASVGGQRRCVHRSVKTFENVAPVR